ncbi:hypothetical protein TRFO_33562 [Tritrichomonas foetus]|uniref:Uncharacterized protein n=1 Tax=Tritrichomonas foetus TaxID=1144522 RepID=A0A1J4JNA7_9EUKA|nr:hypothetical protein TRFO_33562 [Tritrichomonas foetus]|eukprot:OHS99919.1 hypothetical protein TRFO_33562 [Tritrichomonas foetus]
MASQEEMPHPTEEQPPSSLENTENDGQSANLDGLQENIGNSLLSDPKVDQNATKEANQVDQQEENQNQENKNEEIKNQEPPQTAENSKSDNKIPTKDNYEQNVEAVNSLPGATQNDAISNNDNEVNAILSGSEPHSENEPIEKVETESIVNDNNFDNNNKTHQEENDSTNNNTTSKEEEEPKFQIHEPLEPKKQRNESKRDDLITIDSERPPSGYSAYSYSYEYSESEDHTNEVTENNQENNQNNVLESNFDEKVDKLFNPDGRKHHRRRRNNNNNQNVKNKSSKSSRFEKEPPVDVPQDEMSVLKAKAMNLEPLEDLDDEIYEALIRSLAEDRKEQAMNDNFEESERLNSAIEHVSASQLDQRKFKLQQEAYDDYCVQMDRVQNELQQFDEESQRLELDLKAKLDTQQQRIEAAHEKELDNHSDQWTSDAKKKQYNHASSRLLFLRKQFQQLIIQCRFKEAAEVKAEINKVEAYEQREALKVMQHNFDESLKKIETRHAEELQFFRTRADIQLKQLRQNRAKLRIALQNKESKLKRIEDRIRDADKLWNYTQMQRIEEVSAGKSRDAKVTSKLSPREFGRKEETTIALPPLNLRRGPPKTAR